MGSSEGTYEGSILQTAKEHGWPKAFEKSKYKYYSPGIIEYVVGIHWGYVKLKLIADHYPWEKADWKHYFKGSEVEGWALEGNATQQAIRWWGSQNPKHDWKKHTGYIDSSFAPLKWCKFRDGIG